METPDEDRINVNLGLVPISEADGWRNAASANVPPLKMAPWLRHVANQQVAALVARRARAAEASS